jgi:GNAT superfamily N-acetyltransferase
MIEVAIREAEEADLPAILSVYRGAGLDSARTLPLDEAHVVFRRIKSYPDYKIFVATHDSAVVGTFALLIMDNLVNGGLPSGVVEDVAVAAEYQGQGIGKQMMNFAFERCRQRGCYKLVLSSNEKRQAAHQFYESLGFVRHGFSFRVNLNTQPQDNNRMDTRDKSRAGHAKR